MPAFPKDRRDDGFTLIELLVVVVIIGILAAIAIPVFLGQQDSARDAAVKSDLTEARIALLSYATQHDDKYLNGTVQLTADDLAPYGFTPSPGATDFVVDATSDGHFCLSERSNSSGSPVWSAHNDSPPVIAACS